MAGIIEGLQGLLGSLLGEDTQSFRPQNPAEDPPAVIQQVERNDPTVAPPGLIEEIKAGTRNLGDPVRSFPSKVEEAEPPKEVAVSTQNIEQATQDLDGPLDLLNSTPFSGYDFDEEDETANPISEKEEKLGTAWEEKQKDKYSKRVSEGKNGIPVDSDAEFSEFYTEVQRSENPMTEESGWNKDTKTFMPFKSIEGTGKGKTASEFEIGFGMKIQKKWLSDNKNDWPTIGGVKTDIRKGISLKQAQLWSKETLDFYRKEASNLIPDFDKMPSGVQIAWVDLFYNGHTSAWKANPKAKDATEKGFVTEGVFQLLDYISGGPKGAKVKYRGLLNRRINAYNRVAEQTGDPQIISYTWGSEISIELDGEISSKNWSDKLASKINKNSGKWIIAKNNKQATGETFNISGGKFGG